MKNFKIEKQEIITGSSRLVNSNKNFDRISFACKNMHHNKAYKFFLEQKNCKDNDKKILKKFINEFQEYRKNWKQLPREMYNLNFSEFLKNDLQGPLCVDIETASICDLACPHCYREYILTPDKIMNFKLYKNIIDEISELKVPSIKLNWRGEPLLNSKIDEFILYAKKKGILEVAINTNATHLNKDMSKKIIDSGLDFIIYSFDGGTKNTYENMRPGRFKKNSFEDVISNIKNFSEIKRTMKSVFPITKIQMVLTNDTRKEINEFFKLFNGIVDDVTVTPYSERGGNLEDLSLEQKKRLTKYLEKENLPIDTPYMVEAHEKISISTKRKSCEQIFQRLMITYDGRVAMCCMDWGAQHCIGYIDKSAQNIDKTLKELKDKIQKNKSGFELLKNAKFPQKFNEPKFEIKKIKELWNGAEINKVRKIHHKAELNNIDICKKCDFKDTYLWREID